MELIRSNRIFNAGILMASMNHELRNPLYVIKGLSEAYLTDEQAQEEDAVDVVNRTARQAERAIGIMQQFSHFVKPPRNETAEHLTNPAHCLAEVCNLVRHQVNVKKIQFETVIPDGLQPLAMPKLHFEEVMLNLILNACQAVPDEGKVRIEFIQKADFLTATISDSGTGIDKEISKDLFQPFKSSKTSGLGLGLYITKQLVERNNGTIDCKSSNAGTLFSLKIPCQTLVSA
jgi:signal transduction histidine kinase